MKTKFFIFSFLAVMMFSTSCIDTRTKSEKQKTEEYILPKGKKLVTATWKDGELWYLTRDMHPEENAEVYQFSREKNDGVNFLEDLYVTIKEQK